MFKHLSNLSRCSQSDSKESDPCRGRRIYCSEPEPSHKVFLQPEADSVSSNTQKNNNAKKYFSHNFLHHFKGKYQSHFGQFEGLMTIKEIKNGNK